MERLESGSDPDWLTGDVIGALSALSGQSFGWDVEAWKAWWLREGRPGGVASSEGS
jgi:hypothetical protein